MSFPSASDSSKLALCEPRFAAQILAVGLRIKFLLTGTTFDVLIAETWRSHEQQWALYRKGRRLVGDTWELDPTLGPVRTNATPTNTPHCLIDKAGAPSALGADLWIVHPDGKLARDAHPVWAVVPYAAFAEHGEALVIGAAFSTIRGGDWPHLEAQRWKQRSVAGVLQS